MANTTIPLARTSDLSGVAQETTLSGVATDVGTVKSDVATIKSDVTTVKTDVATVKSDVTTVKSDVTTVKSDVATVKSDVTAIKTDVGTIKENVATLLARQVEIVVTCVTQDDVTVTGQTVTLRAGSSAQAEVYDTRAYNGQAVTFQVPKDFRYFVEVSSTLTGHFAPTTATGTATTNTTNVTLTYSDISHISTFEDIKSAMDSIQSQAEGRAALVGIEIADTWTDDDGLTVYSDPKIVQDVQYVKDPSGVEHLAAIMMPKYASKYSIQFDAPESGEAGYATEATAQGGIYYWGYGAVFSTSKTYAVNAFCSYLGGIWKCTTAVSTAGAWDATSWSLLDAVFYSNAKTYAIGDYAKYGGKVYQCTTAVDTAEDFDDTKWEQILASPSFQFGALVYVSHSTGATIDYSAYGAFYHTDISSSNKDYFVYGYNNWEYSANRQYYNSAAGIGEWWTPAHVGDCPPNQLSVNRGWKAGCSAALLQYAKPIRVPVWPWNKSPEYTIDTFWLPSVTEMFGAGNDSEGYAFKKVADDCYTISGWTTAQNGNTNARVYRRVSATSTAVGAWLRSAARSASSYTWLVFSTGTLYYANYASLAFAGLPACAIY